MQFSFIYPIDRALSGATIPSLSGPGSYGNEGVLCIPQSPHHWNLNIRLFNVISGHSLVGEKQLVYSTAPADWVELQIKYTEKNHNDSEKQMLRYFKRQTY